jgi:hypothetical protein
VNLENVLSFAYVAVEAALIGLLLYRRVWRTFPFFLSYCIWDVLSNVCIVYVVLRHYPAAYFHVYFVQTIIDSALQFCVLVELTWSVLRPIRSSLSRRSLVIVAVLILLAGAAIWPFASLPGLAHDTTKQGLLLVQLVQTVSILRILFFLLLAGGSQFLSISWRDRELQVATGLGFYSLATVSVSILETRQSSGLQYIRLQELVWIGFLCSLIYWLVSFAQKEAERREFTPQMLNLLLTVAGAARSTRVALEDSRASKSRTQGRR